MYRVPTRARHILPGGQRQGGEERAGGYLRGDSTTRGRRHQPRGQYTRAEKLCGDDVPANAGSDHQEKTRHTGKKTRHMSYSISYLAQIRYIVMYLLCLIGTFIYKFAPSDYVTDIPDGDVFIVRVTETVFPQQLAVLPHAVSQ